MVEPGAPQFRTFRIGLGRRRFIVQYFNYVSMGHSLGVVPTGGHRLWVQVEG